MAHDYLTVADVLGMHTVLIQRYGGAPGVRDPGALESALFRPQTGYYEDIVAEAAALLESLAINHPFVDGNKRIAFAAADVFRASMAGACSARQCRSTPRCSRCSRPEPLISPTSSPGCGRSLSRQSDCVKVGGVAIRVKR